MEADELRIGNWINIYDDFNAQLTGTTNTNKAWFVKNPHDTDCAFNVHQIKPIPLTEEWVKRCEFKFKELGFDDLSVSVGMASKDIHFVIGNYYVKLEHVHRLQNLYRDLTNKELGICTT